MSSIESKPALKIFCSECKQKMDVTEFKSFSNFPCPVCKNTIVVPKKIGDLYLSEKLSDDEECETFLGLKDKNKVSVKLFKKKLEGQLGIQACIKMLSEKYKDFTFSEHDGQIAGYKEGHIEAVKSKESPKKSAKKSPAKSKKQNQLSSVSAGAVQVKSTRVKRRSNTNNAIFIIGGVIAAIMVLAFLAMSGSSKTETDIAKVEVEKEKKKPEKEASDEQKIKDQQTLARQEEEKRQELEKEAALAREEEEKRRQELALAKEKAEKEAAKEREMELEKFRSLVRPSQEKLAIFNSLPEVSFTHLNTLMNKHCVECHNAKKTKGDLDLDVFNDQISIYRGYEVLKHAYNSVVHGDMPPDEDDISDSDRKHLISYLEKLIYTLDSKPGNFNNTAIIRRLTPYEFDNTVLDITGLDLKIGESFPADGNGNQGFSNDADIMGVSPILMEKYIEAAELISNYAEFDIEKGITFNKSEVNAALVDDFESELRKQIFSVSRKVYPGNFQVESSLPRLMQAVSAIKHNLTDKKTLEEVAGNYRLYPAFIQNGLKYFSSSAGKSEIEQKALMKWQSLRQGRVTEETLNEAIKEFADFYKNSSFFLANRRHKDRHKHIDIVDNVESLFFLNNDFAQEVLQGSRPGDYQKTIAVYKFSRFAKSGRDGRNIYSIIAPHIQEFLSKVYRRPPQESELAIRVKDFLNDSITYGMPIASRILVIREFSSMNFAFRIESKRSSKVDDYDLASRLSYFLWAGPPDEELLSLASKGELKKEATLLLQVERMLKDKKSARLAKHFANQWLGFGKILEYEGPSSKLYSGYDKELAKDMWQETAMCFNYIVKNDRSILEIVDADYTIVNNRLSRLYGLNQTSSSFKKVKVDKSKRGGILGHASFLTMTSLSQRTSPIIRGNWVLTTLLGVYVPPAPMNVPALPEEEVLSESLSLAQQLAKHRNIAACRGCHKKIDPLGIVLENYDPVGRWRDSYQNAAINSVATVDESEITGPLDLKNYLLKNKIQFIRNLSKKLISYGLGRSTYFYDNFLVNDMIEKSIQENYKFSALVKTFVLSPQFQQK